MASSTDRMGQWVVFFKVDFLERDHDLDGCTVLHSNMRCKQVSCLECQGFLGHVGRRNGQWQDVDVDDVDPKQQTQVQCMHSFPIYILRHFLDAHCGMCPLYDLLRPPFNSCSD